MNISAVISFEDPKGLLCRLLCDHTSSLKKAGRSQATFENSKNTTTISIEASDSAALRAAFNSITKLITVYEKSGEIE